MTILTTTSSFGKSDPTSLKILENEGFHVVLNPLARTLKEDEVLDLLETHKPVGIIAGVEPLTGSVLQEAGKYLKVVSRCGTGMDNVDLEAAKEFGITVRNTPEAPAEAVAELTLGLILALLRNIPLHNQAVHAGFWSKKMGLLLSETTVGLIGLGRIGKRVAAALDLLGAKVIASDTLPDQAWLAAHPRIHIVGVDELLPASDVVSLHLPSASGPLKHFMNAGKLAKMKPGAYLINTSRGGLIDEAALIASLNSEHLAGAAIDVFEDEPYTKGPLLQQPNVIVSPHVGSFARATRSRMEIEAAQNLLHALETPAAS